MDTVTNIELLGRLRERFTSIKIIHKRRDVLIDHIVYHKEVVKTIIEVSAKKTLYILSDIGFIVQHLCQAELADHG